MYKPTIFYALTYNCIRHCNFCFNSRYANYDIAFDLKAYTHVITELQEWNSSKPEKLSLNLTGGEPLLEPDITKVLQLAKGAGLEIFLTTAGVPINNSIARAIKDSDTKVTISFDCHKRDIYEQTRGLNTYDKAISCFDTLASHNCLHRAIIVINKASLPFIHETIDYLKSNYGVVDFILMELSVTPELFDNTGARLSQDLLQDIKTFFPDLSITVGHYCPITLNVSPDGHYFTLLPPDHFNMLGDARTTSLQTAIDGYRKESAAYRLIRPTCSDLVVTQR